MVLGRRRQKRNSAQVQDLPVLSQGLIRLVIHLDGGHRCLQSINLSRVIGQAPTASSSGRAIATIAASQALL